MSANVYIRFGAAFCISESGPRSLEMRQIKCGGANPKFWPNHAHDLRVQFICLTTSGLEFFCSEAPTNIRPTNWSDSLDLEQAPLPQVVSHDVALSVFADTPLFILASNGSVSETVQLCYAAPVFATRELTLTSVSILKGLSATVRSRWCQSHAAGFSRWIAKV